MGGGGGTGSLNESWDARQPCTVNLSNFLTASSQGWTAGRAKSLGLRRYNDRMTTTLPLLLLFAAGAAGAVDDAVVLRCRALPDPAARFACYEAMPVVVAPPEQRFGGKRLEQKVDDEPQAIRSTVRGHLDGWRYGTEIALANGQVWRVVDDDEAVLPDLADPPVRVERGALGAYYLQLETNHSAARVVRIK